MTGRIRSTLADALFAAVSVGAAILVEIGHAIKDRIKR